LIIGTRCKGLRSQDFVGLSLLFGVIFPFNVAIVQLNDKSALLF
jgi:hypothetical protein